MDYEKLGKAITERTKAIIPVDVAGIICDYNKIYDIVEKNRIRNSNRDNDIQKALGRIAIIADSSHAFGAEKKWKEVRRVGRFHLFLFSCCKKSNNGRRWSCYMEG